MKNKTLTLTIVIPVFNEEDHLADCLESIAGQIVMPDEVIVVDNNSTDASVQIAKSFPFVQVIHEKNQHQAFAQKTGFDMAKGDIIGRIDADTIMPRDWVVNIKKAFAENSVEAVTGGPQPYDIYMKKGARAVFMFYHNLASKIAGVQMIWGANAAIRKTAWNDISSKVLQRADIWEDYDLALLFEDKSAVKYLNNVDVGSSFRTVHKSLIRQTRWHWRLIRTFYHRRSLFRTSILALAWHTMVILYPLVLVDEYILKPLFAFEERRTEILDSPALLD